MNPTDTYHDLRRAQAEGNWEAAYTYALALYKWMADGGARPIIPHEHQVTIFMGFLSDIMAKHAVEKVHADLDKLEAVIGRQAE